MHIDIAFFISSRGTAGGTVEIDLLIFENHYSQHLRKGFLSFSTDRIFIFKVIKSVKTQLIEV